MHSPEGVYQKWHCASTNMNVNDDGYVHRRIKPMLNAIGTFSVISESSSLLRGDLEKACHNFKNFLMKSGFDGKEQTLIFSGRVFDISAKRSLLMLTALAKTSVVFCCCFVSMVRRKYFNMKKWPLRWGKDSKCCCAISQYVFYVIKHLSYMSSYWYSIQY